MYSFRKSACTRILALVLAGMVLVPACTQATPARVPSATTRSSLVYYESPTPSRTGEHPKPVQAIWKTPQPPTQTPMTYKAVKGDTLLGIALKYGLTLEELQAANPQVDPRLLSVGTDLVIPLGEGKSAFLATPTPLPVELSEPACYRTADAGAWCFVTVHNTQAEMLENVSARIYLLSESGAILAAKDAYPPLSLLPGRGNIPAMAFLEPPLPQDLFPAAELLSALPATQVEKRYLPVSIRAELVGIDPAGLVATVEGSLKIPGDEPVAGTVWVAGIAYGADGRVVGVRQLEWSGLFSGGEVVPVSLQVYSLGPAIERVELFAEGRPDSQAATGTPQPD